MSQPGFAPSTAEDLNLSLPNLAVAFKAGSPIKAIFTANERKSNLSLPSEFSQVTSARLFTPNRLIVTGMMNGDASEVLIIDPLHEHLVDKFLCYSPAVSPNGRYVVSIRFFPTHGVSGVEDHYTLYDVSKTPEQNRSGPAKSPIVGQIVFPLKETLSNVDIENRPVHFMAADGFFWNEDSGVLLFADKLADKYSLVTIRLNAGNPTARLVEVPNEWICPQGVQPCYANLATADFSQVDSTAKLTFNTVNGTPNKVTHLRMVLSSTKDPMLLLE